MPGTKKANKPAKKDDTADRVKKKLLENPDSCPFC